MTIREIPKAYVYTCDACGVEHLQENAAGPYTDRRPPEWNRLKWNASEFEKLFCPTCTKVVTNALNFAITRQHP